MKMTTNNSNQTGFIARSAINPKLILCTDNEFHTEIFVGAGQELGAKVFKTKRGAVTAKGRQNLAVKVVNGVEQN
jgi:hypothetical protein